jgi:hypothetical protein
VNGTLAPVPLGTLNGDWAQYGGVPGPFSAWAGVAASKAGKAANAVTTATTEATRRPRFRTAAVGNAADLLVMDISVGSLSLVTGKRALSRSVGSLDAKLQE